MRAVIQRVSNAKVSINGIEESIIDRGLLLFLGIEVDDTKEDLKWLVNKIINLRIFNDSNGVMNISLLDSKGELLVVSQFTLIASSRKGNRPSYVRAAKHDIAIPLYESFIKLCEEKLLKKVKRGVFGADMKVELSNDGPVTLIIDSKIKE
ncbi:MAG: D-tyrosyl-tRNA(Tyr) deacylase [Flavobacteriaceae bacterium]|nr:D-tyrosyl-tRNA(Tyr) deacylase [Flavobacteriaceae bacterium]